MNNKNIKLMLLCITAFLYPIAGLILVMLESRKKDSSDKV